MKQSKKNAFTLIELIGVLVIMAIIALIATPLVMNIIRKARISADKRSVDAYGRSIELAIAGYLLDTGSFPTSIGELTIEYSGSEVVCSTTQLNSDSSVYLADCTVDERSVGDYTYGSDKSPSHTAYTVGDEVTYNNVDYYVIKDSAASEDSVTLLKAEPLSAEEITTYSAGTGAQTNENGEMRYHSNSNNYATSYVKTTVNGWKNVKAPVALEARLITIDEITILGYEWKKACDTCVAGWMKTEDVPSWLYSLNYQYWTSSPCHDSETGVWSVISGGDLTCQGVEDPINYWNVRPVIVLPKSAL